MYGIECQYAFSKTGCFFLTSPLMYAAAWIGFCWRRRVFSIGYAGDVRKKHTGHEFIVRQVNFIFAALSYTLGGQQLVFDNPSFTHEAPLPLYLRRGL